MAEKKPVWKAIRRIWTRHPATRVKGNDKARRNKYACRKGPKRAK